MCELSIIVPVYKVEQYLSKCIESILNQEYKDFELLLIDDGSPDNCGSICDKYAKLDSRIKVIHKTNNGVSAARNSALNIVSGKYIGFVDSDDWIDFNMYKEMVQCINATDSDLVICGVKYYTNEETYSRSGLVGSGLLSNNDLLKSLFMSPNPIGGGCVNKIFRFSSVSEVRFDENLSMAEDWVYLFNCLERCKKGVFLQKALYCIRERPSSATRSNEIKTIDDVIFGGKSDLAISLAKHHSFELESLAVDKFLDDCFRYSIILKKALGIKRVYQYRSLYYRIQIKAFMVLVYAVFRKLLSKSKIRGYFFGFIKR